MNHRAQQTWWLLASYLDWIPNPSTWRNNPLNWRTDSGEAPSQTIVCATCQGEGRLRGNLCGHCLGHGVRTVDTYTEQAVSTVNQAVTRTRAVTCDSCAGQGAYGNGKRCDYCDGTGHVQLPDTSPVTTSPGQRVSHAASDERQAQQWRQGSYPELETALTWLEHRQPWAHSLVWRYLIHQPPVTIGPSLTILLEHTTVQLSHRLPHRIRVPAWAVPQPARTGNGRWANTHAQTERDRRIRREHQAGRRTNELAAEHGLSPRRIQGIVR